MKGHRRRAQGNRTKGPSTLRIIGPSELEGLDPAARRGLDPNQTFTERVGSDFPRCPAPLARPSPRAKTWKTRRAAVSRFCCWNQPAATCDERHDSERLPAVNEDAKTLRMGAAAPGMDSGGGDGKVNWTSIDSFTLIRCGTKCHKSVAAKIDQFASPIPSEGSFTKEGLLQRAPP